MAKLGSCLLVFLLFFTTTSPALAESGDGLGHSPYAAQPLNYGLNIGSLAAGEAYWYVFNGSEPGTQPDQTLTLHMVCRPNEFDVTPYVNFQLFTFDEADRWLRGDGDVSPATGVFTTTDFDQATAERLWSGTMAPGETYYVRVFNNSRQPVDYHLTALGQPRASSSQARPSSAKSSVQPSPASVRASSSGGSPAPGATTDDTEWLLIAAAVKNMSTQEAAAWLKMADQAGWLPRSNGTASPGYSVSTAALYEGSSAEPAAQPSLSSGGKATPAAPAPSPSELYPNIYPAAPLALRDGANVGKLAPGGEHWYSFIHDSHDSDWYHYMALTLFSTPTDGNNSHDINFQIFTGDELHIWQRGTPQDMRVMGDGQWVSRDKDPVTGERVWAGKVVEGDLYYVRVFNHTDRVIDYYLITQDILNTELGDRVWAATRYYGQVFWQPATYVRIRH
jgi:hypothetical protein